MGKKNIKFNTGMLLLVLFFFIFPFQAYAHFGMVIPSDSMVMKNDVKNIKIDLSFSHPCERIGMELVKPNIFGVMVNGIKKDLASDLKKIDVMGNKAWQADYKIKRPGAYMFYMEPVPYWEPAEDCFIIHYTKTVVAAFGDDEGWDRKTGLKTEIVPLSKPFGLYVGNVFQGTVLLDSKPVPFSEVEVEYYNESGKMNPPTDYMVTQTIKTDANGLFTYAAPMAGWWGFAALNSADYKIEHNGTEKDVELGAVIWVEFQDLGIK